MYTNLHTFSHTFTNRFFLPVDNKIRVTRKSREEGERGREKPFSSHDTKPREPGSEGRCYGEQPRGKERRPHFHKSYVVYTFTNRTTRIPRPRLPMSQPSCLTLAVQRLRRCLPGRRIRPSALRWDFCVLSAWYGSSKQIAFK